MAKHYPLLLFLLLLTTTIAAAPLLPSTAPATPITTTPQEKDHNNNDPQQLSNIMDALIGAGDFNNWADMLSAAIDTAVFPLSATFFIPTNDYPPNLHMDPFVAFAYHVVPQRLTFSDLCLLRPFSRLPTLIPSKSILITNSSVSNFTIDNSLVSEPDLYLTSTISVHGVSSFLDYSVYGGNDTLFLPEPLSPVPPPPPPPPHVFVPAEEEIGSGGHSGGGIGGGRKSNAASSCWEFQRILLVVCGFLAFKICKDLLFLGV